MSIYAVDKLMAETRRLASEYHRQTGQVLPVSAELAKYDAKRLLALTVPETVESGVDLIGQDGEAEKKFQVKSRVVFTDQKSRPTVGQLNFQAAWDQTLLVIYSEDYEPQEIFSAAKDKLQAALTENKPDKKNKAHKDKPKEKKEKTKCSVAKFKAISEQVWPQE